MLCLRSFRYAFLLLLHQNGETLGVELFPIPPPLHSDHLISLLLEALGDLGWGAFIL